MDPAPLRLRSLVPPDEPDALTEDEYGRPLQTAEENGEAPSLSTTPVALRRRFVESDHSRPELDTESVDELDEWIPRGGLGTWSLGRIGGAALLVVVLVCAGFALAQLLRSEPQTVSAPQLPGIGEVGAPNTSEEPHLTGVAPEPTPETGGPVIVSVVGLVHNPGLVTLASGSRVADAIAAAGGSRDGADTATLNLARPVADGEQVVVGALPPDGAPPPGSAVLAAGGAPEPAGPDSAGGRAESAEPGGEGKVNLNSASAAELESLNGVGPATASAIIEYRESSGPFSSVEQLGEVKGIGPAKLENLREQVVV